jgi:protein phosphatase
MAGPRIGLECSVVCDRGSGVRRCEDQFLVAELGRSLLVHETSLPQADHSRIVGRSQGTMLVVATGRGAAGAGAVAGTVAVDAVTGWVLNAMPWLCGREPGRPDHLVEALGDALRRCQAAVRAARAGGALEASGLDLTLAYLLGSRAYVVRVGRTRCHLWRPPTLTEIKSENTGGGQAAASATVPREAAERAWRRLACHTQETSDNPRPDVYRVDLEPADALLLATEGLARHVPDPAIVDELTAPTCLRRGAEICRRLVERAREAGSSSDITVVLARTRSASERRRIARAHA